MSTQTANGSKEIIVKVECFGSWIFLEELQKTALEAVAQNCDIAIDVQYLDYLDAGALQILLALNATQNERGHCLRITNATEGMKQWFEYSGAFEKFFVNRADQQ